jgi:hypothetical protein
MQCKIHTLPYQKSAFSRPWIAKVIDWRFVSRPVLSWGECIEEFPGSEGLLTIIAEPGDVIRWGQKSYCGFGSSNLWGLVLGDGRVAQVPSATAREHWDRRFLPDSAPVAAELAADLKVEVEEAAAAADPDPGFTIAFCSP